MAISQMPGRQVKNDLTSADFNASYVDGIATDASLRTLGTGAQQAAPGNHTHTPSEVGLSNVDNTSDATKNSAVATLTNKRITSRVMSLTSSASITPTGDTVDLVDVTALAHDPTFNAPSGTPTNGQILRLHIKDSGSFRNLTWDAAYITGMGPALPSVTTAGKLMLLMFVYSSGLAKWVMVDLQVQDELRIRHYGSSADTWRFGSTNNVILGQNGSGANVTLNFPSHSGNIKVSFLATAASASTVDLGQEVGDFITITGTTTITGFTSTSGATGLQRVVRFAGSLQLTHNASSFILPTGANIQTAAGDIALFRCLTTGTDWVCESYMRASGLPLTEALFALLAGRSGGQTINGGTGSGETLTLRSTSHATKGATVMDSGVTIGGASGTRVGDLEVSSQAAADGTDPTALVIRSTLNSGSWTPGANWGVLDFRSDDASGVGAGTRARIAAQASSANGGGCELTFYVDAGAGLAQAMRFTKDAYFSLGGSAAAATLAVQTISAATIGVYVSGVASQTGDLFRWADSGAAVLGRIEADGDMAVGSAAPSARLHVQSNATGAIVLIASAFSGQTANVLECRNSSAGVMAAFDKDGNLILNIAGVGIKIKEGTNATMGTATLVAGTVTVNTTKVTANSRIMLTPQGAGGTVGAVYVSARTAGTSFTITSTNAAHTAAVGWVLFEPA